LSKGNQKENEGVFFGQLFGLMAFVDFHSPSGLPFYITAGRFVSAP